MTAMKTIYKISVAGALLMIFMSGCEKKLENYDFIETEPCLVINAPFFADSSVTIHVSEPVDVMDIDYFPYRDDALAELFSNGSRVSVASYQDTGFYSFDYIPAAGDELTLNVTAPGLPDASASFTIPPVPQFVSIDYTGLDHNYGARFRITLEDHPGRTDYYGISLWSYSGWLEYDEFGVVIDTVYDGFFPGYLYSTDISVAGGITDYHLQSGGQWQEIFSGTTLLVEDKFFDGKELTVDLFCQETYFYAEIGSPIFIVIEAYSEEYVRYLRSIEKYRNSDDNPLAEAVSIYSNISGGVGLAFGKSVSRDTVAAPPELGYLRW